MIPQPYPTPLRTGRGGQCDICKRTGIPVTEVTTPHGKIIHICYDCYRKFGGKTFTDKKPRDNFDDDFADEWAAPSSTKRVKKFDRLYKKDTLGKIRIWDISVDKVGTDFIINTSSGIEGGKIKHDPGVTISVGKVNRTAKEQAIAEASSKWVHKLDTGYYDNKLDAIGCKRVNPMLASRFDKPAKAKKIVYPVIAQRKFDGVRCMARMVANGGFPHDVSLTSRTGRQWLDLDHIRQQIANLKIPTNIIMDGEIYAHHLTFNRINGLTKKEKLDERDKKDLASTNLRIYDVVDIDNPTWSYKDRYRYLKNLLTKNPQSNLILTKNYRVDKPEDIPAMHEKFLEQGFEGLMLRNVDSPYEQKRSNHLQKVKKFVDDEFTVVGYKEGKGAAKGTPVWICETPEGATFGARPMGTQAEKEEMWKNRDELVGEELTVKYFPPKDPVSGIPRIPVGKGFRSKEDLPEKETKAAEPSYRHHSVFQPKSIYRLAVKSSPLQPEKDIDTYHLLEDALDAFDQSVESHPYETTLYQEIDGYRTHHGMVFQPQTVLVLRQKYDYLTGNDKEFMDQVKARYGTNYRYMAEQADPNPLTLSEREWATGDSFSQQELSSWLASIKDEKELSIQPTNWTENDWLMVKRIISHTKNYDHPYDEYIEYRFDLIEEEPDLWVLDSIAQPYAVTMAYPHFREYRVNATSPDDAADEAERGTGYSLGEGNLSKYPIFTYRTDFRPDSDDALPSYGKYAAESATTNTDVIGMSKGSKFLLISGVTFAFFFTEALIHYNLGEADGRVINWDIPPAAELMKIGGIVAGFSILSGLTISTLERHIRS